MSQTNYKQLERITSTENLERAWKRIRAKKSAGGIDGETVSDFGERIDEELEKLREDLLNGTYVPRPLLQLKIPKETKPGETRALGLPAVRDKVAQEAVRCIIEPLIDREFLDNSYGYRQGKGPHKAVKRVLHIIKQLRMSWVGILDIDDFFPSIDHDILLNQLRSHGIEEPVCCLLLLWLKMGVVTSQGKWIDVYHGVSQGGVVSPLLANIYLHPLDTYLRTQNVEFVRYADDIRLFSTSRKKAEDIYNETCRFLDKQLKLKPNSLPEPIIPLENGVSFLGFLFTSDRLLIEPGKWQGIQAKLNQIFYGQKSEDWNVFFKKLNESVAGWIRYYAPLVDPSEMKKLQEEIKKALAIKLSDQYVKYNNTLSEPLEQLLEHMEIPACKDTAERKEFLSDLIQQSRELFRQQKDWAQAKQNVERIVRREKRHHVRQVVHTSHLIISTPGFFVGKTSNLIVIRQNRKVLYEVPAHQLESITILSHSISLSSDLITLCGREGIPLCWISPKGDVEALVLSPDGPSVELQKKQLEISQTPKQAFGIARSFVLGKIKNQIHLIKYFGKYERKRNQAFSQPYSAFEEIAQKCLDEIYHLQFSEDWPHLRGQLFSIEGRVASHYWDMVKMLLDGAVEFPGRERKGATDLVNSMLNYGYAVLQSRVLIELYRAGLNPSVSFLHVPQKGNPTLAFDVMEVFRPQTVDRVVIAEIRRHQKVFQTDHAGQLTQEARRHLIRQINNRLVAIEFFRGRELKLEEIIREQVKDLRRQLEGKTRYRPYIGKW